MTELGRVQQRTDVFFSAATDLHWRTRLERGTTRPANQPVTRHQRRSGPDTMFFCRVYSIRSERGSERSLARLLCNTLGWGVTAGPGWAGVVGATSGRVTRVSGRRCGKRDALCRRLMGTGTALTLGAGPLCHRRILQQYFPRPTKRQADLAETGRWHLLCTTVVVAPGRWTSLQHC